MSYIQADIPNVYPIGETLDIPCDQEVPPSLLASGMSALQFSNREDGPWVTARDAAGAVRGSIHPWSAQNSEFIQQGSVHQSAWVRVGVWPVTGDPYSEAPQIHSNAGWLKGLHVQAGEAP